MQPLKTTAVLLLVANPVDVLTYFAHSYSGLPATQVIGSGTFLDSARLRGKLAGEVGVAASSIDAWVLGEHGESQIVSFFLYLYICARVVLFECCCAGIRVAMRCDALWRRTF